MARMTAARARRLAGIWLGAATVGVLTQVALDLTGHHQLSSLLVGIFPLCTAVSLWYAGWARGLNQRGDKR
jgi:hypothetical protein